jgi:hypothetical protein
MGKIWKKRIDFYFWSKNGQKTVFSLFLSVQITDYV